MGGHSFLDRCNHLHQSDKEEVSVLTADCCSPGEKLPLTGSLFLDVHLPGTSVYSTDTRKLTH